MDHQSKVNLDRQCSLPCMTDASAISLHTPPPEVTSTEGLPKDHSCDISKSKDSFSGTDQVSGIEAGGEVPFGSSSEGHLPTHETLFDKKSGDNSVASPNCKACDATQTSDSEDDEGWVKTSVCTRSATDAKRSRLPNITKFHSCQEIQLETTMPHHPIVSFSECAAITPEIVTQTFLKSDHPHTSTQIRDRLSTAPDTVYGTGLNSIATEKQPTGAKGHFMQSTAFSRSTLVPQLSPLDYYSNTTTTQVGSKSLNYTRVPTHLLSNSGAVDNNWDPRTFMDLVPGTFPDTLGMWDPDPTASFRAESLLLSSAVKQKGRSALIAELMHRRESLKKKFTQLQHTVTSKNIFAIVRASKASQLQYLLQEKLLKVDERDYNGCTPLHVAATEGNMTIIKVLLSFGADVLALDSFGRTPLDCAASHRQSGVARYLMAVIRAQWQQEAATAGEDQNAGRVDEAVVAGLPEMLPPMSLPTTPGSSVTSSPNQTQSYRINVDASFLSIPDFTLIQASDKMVGARVLDRAPLEGVETGTGAAPSSRSVHPSGAHAGGSSRSETRVGEGGTALFGAHPIEAQPCDPIPEQQGVQKAASLEEKSLSMVDIVTQHHRGEFEAVMPPAVTPKAGAPGQASECAMGSDTTTGQTPKKLSLSSEVEKDLVHEKAADVEIILREHSKFTTIPESISLIVCLCGLPGRGKSYISVRLMRYMNWKGIPCRVFNAGNYRRKLLGVEGTSKSDFYDPNNLQGRKQREIMAALACEDLVNFIAHHRVAIGILDATNTTKSRRLKLKNFFAVECQKRDLQYRLLFIESVCTDEGVITENILRSKCKNDDFKGFNDTSAVIAEFRHRIQQYEKVYEPLHPSEGLSFIKIINAKRHIILYKVFSGLGSRVGFFLTNLHPIAYPIYIVLPGETEGDCERVYGGSERLTSRGESFSRALKHFIQDRYVPHMLILHGTNQSVLSTLRPLLQGDDEAAGKPDLNYLYQPLAHHHAFDAERVHNRHYKDEDGNASPTHNAGIVYCRHAATTGHSPRSIVSPNVSEAWHMVTPRSQVNRTPFTIRPTGDFDSLKGIKGGDAGAIPFHDTRQQHQLQEHPEGPKSSLSSTEGLDNNDDDDETLDEVLCGMPGLDNINYGLFSGHDAVWAAEHYPRLAPLIHVSGLADQPPDTTTDTNTTNNNASSAITNTNTNNSNATNIPAACGAAEVPRVPSPVHFSSFSEALHCLCCIPAGADPSLAYNLHFPNGESCRQVSVRLEPALMAVMRTQSPVFVVASPIVAQAVLAFFTDVMPEQLMSLRLPQHSVVEISFNDTITVHPLLPDAELACKPSVVSPILTREEIDKTLQLAYSTC